MLPPFFTGCSEFSCFYALVCGPVRAGTVGAGLGKRTHMSMTSILHKLTIVKVVVLRSVRRFGFCSFPSATKRDT